MIHRSNTNNVTRMVSPIVAREWIEDRQNNAYEAREM